MAAWKKKGERREMKFQSESGGEKQKQATN